MQALKHILDTDETVSKFRNREATNWWTKSDSIVDYMDEDKKGMRTKQFMIVFEIHSHVFSLEEGSEWDITQTEMSFPDFLIEIGLYEKNGNVKYIRENLFSGGKTRTNDFWFKNQYDNFDTI